MHLHLDKYAYCNNLINVHPMEKFVFSIVTLFLCVLLNSPVISIIVIIINSVILVFKAGIKQDVFIKLMLIPLYFLLVGTFTIAFNIITPEIKAIFSFNILTYKIGITQNSFLQAQSIFLKALASVSCLYFLTLTTPLVDIISVMRKFNFPELFLEIMGLVYRFIFIFMATAETIYNSQNSRLGYNSIKSSFKSMGYLISNLFVISFNRANQMFIALESRGYNGSINVLENKFVVSYKNILMIILAEVLFLVIFAVSKLFF